MYIPSTHDIVATGASIAPAAAFYARGYWIHEDEQSPIRKWSSLIGIVTAICGNILISFALNIQRYAHIRLHKEEEEKRRQERRAARRARGYGAMDGAAQSGLLHKDSSRGGLHRHSQSFDSSVSHSSSSSGSDHSRKTTYLHSPYWWAGIALMTIGETGNFLAYGFAPASIVSPLGVVALISNCIIAPLMLKEAFRLRDFWGVLVAVGGAVTVVLSAKQDEKRLGPHEVLDAITRWEFEVYMGITFALIGTLIWASPRYGNKTILIDLGLVGLFGGYTALSTKGVASMLTNGFWQAFGTPVTYALLAVLAGTAVMQVKYVNKALQRFDSTQVIPVQFVMFTLSVIIGSAVLYRDFEKTTPGRASKFVGGCLLTFFGVFLITSGRPHHNDDHDDSETEDERISLATQHNPQIGLNCEYDQSPLQNKGSALPVHRSPLHHELTPPSPSPPGHSGYTSDTESESDATATFPKLSRRSSKVSWALPSPSPAAASTKPPSLRLTPASGSQSESCPLIDFDHQHTDGVQRPALSRIASQNAERGLQSDSAAMAPSTPVRGSSGGGGISGMVPMPGPFISPLSSSLAVVVADTLRRGTDIYGSRRRPRLDLKRTRSHGASDVVRGCESSDEDERVLRRPSTRPGSPRKRSRRRRVGEGVVVSRSLDAESSLLGVAGRRPRAKSLGGRISAFFSLNSGKDGSGEEERSLEGNGVGNANSERRGSDVREQV